MPSTITRKSFRTRIALAHKEAAQTLREGLARVEDQQEGESQ